MDINKRLKDLEKRVDDLERRPVYVPYPVYPQPEPMPSWPQSPFAPSYPYFGDPPYKVTCGVGL